MGHPTGMGQKEAPGAASLRGQCMGLPSLGFPTLGGDHMVVVTDVGLQLHPGAVGPGADEH